MSYTINFSKQMSGILHPNPNMLKSTKEKWRDSQSGTVKLHFLRHRKKI